MTLVNIATHLPRMASLQPHRAAVIYPQGRDRSGRVAYTFLTFQQLDRESNRIASGLTRSGVRPGMRTVLMVKPSLDFFVITFALFKLGAVPIFIDPGMGLAHLKICLGEAQPHAFIGIPKAHLARLLLRWPKMEHLVTVGRKWGWGGVTLNHIRRLGEGNHLEAAVTGPEDSAAILFTSGSTGVPKGAVYTHGTFCSQVDLLKKQYGIQPGEIDLSTFPLFALFGPALGMTAVIPDMDATRPAEVDPEKIFEAVENFGVTNMFGSPALLNRVSRCGDQPTARLHTLKRVISAGAPVQEDILRRFSLLLAPEAQIFTPYGATEALPVCSIGSAEILAETAAKTKRGAGVCVGRPVEGIDLIIIAISDDPIEHWSDEWLLPAGEIGEIVVRGPVVTRTYFNRKASTKLAKIGLPDGGFYHRMGDTGYLDDRGRVWFCGRKAHRVTLADGTLFSSACEGVFNAHPKVFRTALVGIDDGQGTQKPLLCVELEKEHQGADKAKIRRELLVLGAACPKTQTIQRFVFHPGFPVDIRHNAKIFREKLAVWAQTLPEAK